MRSEINVLKTSLPRDEQAETGREANVSDWKIGKRLRQEERQTCQTRIEAKVSDSTRGKRLRLEER